jgi:hypothetical protein
VWAAADALTKYLWNFEVYCGKTKNPIDAESASNTKAKETRNMGISRLCSGKGEGLQG